MRRYLENTRWGGELNLTGGDEKVRSAQRNIQEIRGPIRFRLSDDDGAGVSGVNVGAEHAEPRGCGGNYAGDAE